MQPLNPELSMNKLTPKRRPLDQPEGKAISGGDRRIHALGKQAQHGMTDQQIARRGQMAGAKLSKALYLLPENLTAAISEERRAHGGEAGRQLAKAIINAPSRLRNAVPLANMLKRMNGK